MRMVKRDIGKKWINGLDMTAKLEEERERESRILIIILCFHNEVIDRAPARLVTFISILSGTMY